jgi:hypothetical protein
MSDTSRRDYSYQSMVLEADPDHYVHDEEVYEFSSGRKFLIDDHDKRRLSGGVYGIAIEGNVFWDGNYVSMEWDANGDDVIWDGTVDSTL